MVVVLSICCLSYVIIVLSNGRVFTTYGFAAFSNWIWAYPSYCWCWSPFVYVTPAISAYELVMEMPLEI